MVLPNAHQTLQDLRLDFSEGNVTTDIDLSYLQGLKHLAITGAATWVGLSPSLDRLETLNLNRIQNLIHFNFATLTAWPRLTSLAINECPDLTDITLSAEEDSESVRSHSALTRIDLSSNPKLSKVCPWALRSAPNLRALELSNNPSLWIYPSVLQPLPSLQNVTLSGSRCDCHVVPAPEQAWLETTMSGPCLTDEGETNPSLLQFLLTSCNTSDEVRLPSEPETVQSVQVNSRVVIDCLPNSTFLPEFVAWVTPIHEIRMTSRQTRPGSCQARNDMFEASCVPEDEQLILSRIVYFSGGQQHIRVLENRYYFNKTTCS